MKKFIKNMTYAASVVAISSVMAVSVSAIESGGNIEGKSKKSNQNPVSFKVNKSNSGSSGMYITKGLSDKEKRSPVVFKNSNQQKAVNKKGMGNDVPLHLVMKSLVPGDFNVVYDRSVNKDMKVSWRGGMPWYDILSEVGGNYNLTFDVTERHVLVSSGNKMIISDDPKWQVLPKAKKGLLPAMPDMGSDLVKVVTQFEAKQGLTLVEVLEEWGRVAGWHVQANTTFQFPLKANHTFTGSFEEAAYHLITPFTTGSPAVRARFYKENRILVISTPGAQKSY